MKRINFIRSIIGAIGATALPIEAPKTFEKKQIMQCFVRGFTYYEGKSILKNMKIGDSINLIREAKNRYDECAIQLQYNNKKIGYLPAENNETLSTIMDNNILSPLAEITEINPIANDWQKVEIRVYVMKEVV